MRHFTSKKKVIGKWSTVRDNPNIIGSIPVELLRVSTSHQLLKTPANHLHLFTTISRMHQFGFNLVSMSERLSAPIVSLRVLVAAPLHHKLEKITLENITR